eukprot:8006387-Karenia_brevis.AAC.1
MSISVLGDLFRQEETYSLHMIFLKRDPRVACGSAHKSPIDVQDLVARMESPLQIYPTPPKVRRDSDGQSVAA